MRKLLLVFIITCLLASSSAIYAATSPTLTIHLNGKEMNFPNKPILVEGTTMVPFRNLLESLGVMVDFNATTRTITTTGNNTTVQLVLGEKVAVKNGELIQLAQAPYVNKSVTYVPLRFLSQSFGYDVDFKNNTVYITSSNIEELTDKAPSFTSEGNVLKVEEVGKFANAIAYIEAFSAGGQLLSTGSGVSIDEAGGILTNYHVIEGARKVYVYINDQKYESTDILKKDIKTDLALLDISAKNIPNVKLADSTKLELGESIVTIGSPLGFSNTLSVGNISGGLRKLEEQSYIQFNAPIDHGSSGGALLDMKGRLIGMTTLKVESSANLNFAIPSVEILNFLLLPDDRTAMSGFDSTMATDMGVKQLEYFLKESKFEYNDFIINVTPPKFVVRKIADDKLYEVIAKFEDYVLFVHMNNQISADRFYVETIFKTLFKDIEAELGMTNVAIKLVLDTRLKELPDRRYVVQTNEFSGYKFYTMDQEPGYYYIYQDFGYAERADNIFYYQINELISEQFYEAELN